MRLLFDVIKVRLRRLPGFPLVQALYRLARSPEARGIAWTQFIRGRTVFQPYGTTLPNRYPRIFDFVRNQIEDDEHRRIL